MFTFFKQHKTTLLGVFLASVIFLAYHPMLQSQFKTMDDDASIIRNTQIQSLSNLPDLFNSSFFGQKAYYRPLVSLTFMLEYHFVQLNPFYYNLNNLLLHILNAFLVWVLVSRLTRAPNFAFILALLYGLHPIHWSPVCNIPGRAILLAACFILSAFTCYLKFRDGEGKKWCIYSFILFLLACLSKESAAVFPIVIMAYEGFMREKKWNLASITQYAFGFWVIVFGIIITRYVLGIKQLYHWHSLSDLLLGFVTFLKGLGTYLRLFVLPVDLHFDRSLQLLPSWFNPEVWAVLLATLAVAAVIWVARKWISPLAWFAFIWAGCELLPVSQLVTSIGVQPGYISLAEHFLYIAFIPIVIFVWEAIKGIRDQVPSVGKPMGIIFLTGMMVFFFITTFTHAVYARHEQSMIQRSLSLQPNNARLSYSLGMIYVSKKQYQRAEMHFEKSVKAESNHPRYRMAYAQSLADQGRLIDALENYILVHDEGPLKPLLWKNVNNIHERINAYEDVLGDEQREVTAHFLLGLFYAKQRDIHKSIESFQHVILIKPDHYDSLFNLSSLYGALGDEDKANQYKELFMRHLPAEHPLREQMKITDQ